MKFEPTTPVQELPLSTRTISVLMNIGAKTAEEVLLTGLREIRRMRGCGKKTIAEIREVFPAIQEE